ncbi:hypothetical protein [Desulforegula conservatrix]|uniref:hypothetical protein n=1 Tax=Desulforegula conservatrix TaxID=153026 RepID=UPI0004225907|nr:hypothetical protein [Desulforegula conservatrix]
MPREELLAMLKDIDGIGNYVNEQMANLPAEARKKSEAAVMVQGVKYGLVRLIEAHDKSLESLKSRIEERRNYEEVH